MPWRRRSKRSTSETPAQAELRGAVGRVPRQAEEPGRRGHVDQVAAAPGFDHRRHEALDHVDRAHQVDVDRRRQCSCWSFSTVPQVEMPATFMTTSRLPWRFVDLGRPVRRTAVVVGDVERPWRS